MATTRGDFGLALYAALGITEPSSTGGFTDSGPNDGVFSTLKDLGITVGVGGDRFGGGDTITRGQAFTMMARALGLAGPGTSLQDASQALVDAGLVSGYADGSLRLDAPLETAHVGLLMDRMVPELARVTDPASGATVGTDILDASHQAGQESQASLDPAYAAFLVQQGVDLGRVGVDIDQRQALYLEDANRRSETYSRSMLESEQGINTDFENRGLTRSGARDMGVQKSNTAIGYAQEAAANTAQRAKELADQASFRSRNDLLRGGAKSEIDSNWWTDRQAADDNPAAGPQAYTPQGGTTRPLKRPNKPIKESVLGSDRPYDVTPMDPDRKSGNRIPDEWLR